jgi:F-type H+-transporting ATPase subunit gamma
MATVQDLKRRIRSIRNTRKITKAMELVASARLRRAEARIEALRPYADRMLELMGITTRAAGSVRLPLLERRETVRRVAILPVTADRGLAGAFNAQVLRRAFVLERELRNDGVEVSWLASGRRGRSSLTFRGYELVQSWQGFSERPEYADAQMIARRAAELYANEEVDKVIVIYNRFQSALVQQVTVQELLPTTPSRRRCGATSSTSPSRSRSSSDCCRSTSRPSSTARCLSLPPPSRAPE